MGEGGYCLVYGIFGTGCRGRLWSDFTGTVKGHEYLYFEHDIMPYARARVRCTVPHFRRNV